MQAMPSVTSLSRTARWTSSVMSVTVSPPAVRRRVSCWNTFIVAAILRESLPDSAAEPPHPQWSLRKPIAVVVRIHAPSREGGARVQVPRALSLADLGSGADGERHARADAGWNGGLAVVDDTGWKRDRRLRRAGAGRR